MIKVLNYAVVFKVYVQSDPANSFPKICFNGYNLRFIRRKNLLLARLMYCNKSWNYICVHKYKYIG